MSTNSNNSEEISNLIINYAGEINTNKHPFLLFDLAHVHENDHTRVLLSLLKYNDYQFLPSFLNAIGAPEFEEFTTENDKDELPTDQKKAIGDKGTGFIDLYFEYHSKNNEKVKVILENKIYGAGDTKAQLARYIITAVNSNKTNFINIYSSWNSGKASNLITDEDLKNVHVFYLTSDGSKKPGINSLPQYFGNTKNKDDVDFEPQHIKYYPINYLEHIIPWLENDVLPNMPYSDDGIAIAGVRQYIESIKGMFSGRGNSEAINEYVDKISDLVKRYNKIKSLTDIIKTLLDKKKKKDKKVAQEVIVKLNEQGYEIDDLPLQSLVSDLRATSMVVLESISKEYKLPENEGWNLYFTPSFILMYKDIWWSDDDRKKGYNFPSIHLFCSPTDNIINQKGNISWCIKAVRIPNSKIPQNISNNKKWELKGRDLVLKFNYNGFAKVCKDEYFKNIIKNEIVKNAIDFIDGIIEKASKDDLYQSKVVDELCKDEWN